MTERADAAPLLVEAVRTVARGGDLDARLQALAAQARAVSGASAALIYLVDPATAGLLPAAWSGIPDERIPGLLISDEQDPATRVLRELRPETVEAAGGLGGLPDVSVVAYLPMLVEDSVGGHQVDGVLCAGFTDGRPDAPIMQLLEAVADLAAVAIHNSRLESALAERADWQERLAQTDPLTGLANRRTFDRVLELELARAARQGTSLSVAIFDIDDFEGINTGYGAAAADDVLRKVASGLADSVRLVDTIARYGGDEFALIAPGAAGRAVAERVVESVASTESDLPYPIGLTAGLARFPEQGTSAEELLSAADAALRAARQAGDKVADAAEISTSA